MSVTLLRLGLRRDRVLLPLWLVGIAMTVVFSVIATRDLYGDPASLVSAADTINATGALVALYGKIYDPTSLGAVALIKLTAFGAALVAVLFVFIVIRHTRAEEESGRLELVDSGAIPRSSALSAALVIGMGGSVVLGGLTAGGIALAGLPVAGALAFGLSWALTGIVFSSLAGVAAQLTRSARTAVGLGMAAVAGAYLLRAVGDLSEGDPGIASWLSPIGWSQQIRPFAGDRWWVALIPIAVAALLVLVAFWLQRTRELGDGLLSIERPGPAAGRIRGAFGLAWRQHRGAIAFWIAGLAIMGAILGSIAGDVTGLLDSPQMRAYLVALGGEQGLVDAFLAAEVSIMGVIISAFGAMVVGRLRSEEALGRAELLLSTASRRSTWVGSHTLIAFGGVVTLLAVTGAAIGCAHGLAIGDPVGQAGRMTVAALAQVPAAWVPAGIAVLLFGYRARWVPAIWGLFAAFLVIGEFGPLWKLPDWMLNLSPFVHSPRLPGGTAAPVTLMELGAVAVICVLFGLVLFRRRDLSG